MQRKTNGAKDSLRISLALFIYNIGNRAELCAIAGFKKQRAERSCVFQNEKLFYNIGNCAESCAIACFKKQRAKRGCVFRKEKLFYNCGQDVPRLEKRRGTYPQSAGVQSPADCGTAKQRPCLR